MTAAESPGTTAVPGSTNQPGRAAKSAGRTAEPGATPASEAIPASGVSEATTTSEAASGSGGTTAPGVSRAPGTPHTSEATSASGATTSEAGAAVEFSGVSRHYPGGVRALDGVDLRIDRGEMLAIVGPSGSGKSTLLNLLGTLDAPTSGNVRVFGYDIGSLTDDQLSALRARSIGFVFQQFHLAPNVYAVDNVADGLLYSGVPARTRVRRALRALERVGLADRAYHRPHELSGGQKQRVAIARAVVGSPPLLLADEPTGALDTASGEAVMRVLRELHGDGVTVVVITHDRELAASLPRRVEVRDGRVVEDSGTPGNPGAPQNPGTLPATGIPQDRGAPRASGAPGESGAPQASEIPQTPDASQTPGVSRVPGTPRVPGGSQDLSTPQGLSTPQDPGATGTSKGAGR